MSIVNSASLNYLRIGALGFGAWYGFTRQFSLEKLVVTNKLKAEAHQHELLIEEARVAHEAWENKKEATDGAKENIITDSDSYRFNAEKWMNWALARSEAKK